MTIYFNRSTVPCLSVGAFQAQNKRKKSVKDKCCWRFIFVTILCVVCWTNNVQAMTYRDNKVTFSLQDGFKVVNGTFTVTNLSITNGQDPSRKNTVGMVKTLNSKGEMTFRVGRKGNSKPANFFKDQIPAANNTFNSNPGKLNFAFIGTLELTLTDGFLGGFRETLIFEGIGLAQGHTGGANNWWFGGTNCTNTASGFFVEGSVQCTGYNAATGAEALFDFYRGGDLSSKVSTIKVVPIETSSGKDWMGRIDDSTRLDELVIPGSHDAGMSETAHCTFAARPWTRTQSESVAEQLVSGSRYFDLRVDYYNGELVTFHRNGTLGCNGQPLLDVMNQVKTFLDTNDQETVILVFSHIRDSEGKNTKDEIDVLISNYNSYLFSSSDTSLNLSEVVLGALRGQIIIVYDYADHVDTNKGRFRWANGKDGLLCERNMTGNLSVCDSYANSFNYNTMKTNQLSKWENAPGLGAGYMYLLSWTLTASIPVLNDTIENLAAIANSKLPDVLRDQIVVEGDVMPNIVYIDFVNPQTVQSIIQYNFTASEPLLHHNTAVTELQGISSQEIPFYLDVPAGAKYLDVATAGTTGDANLYVKFDSAPTTSDYDCRGNTADSNEQCFFDESQVQEGRYYGMVHANSDFTDVDVTVAADESAEVVSIGNQSWTDRNVDVTRSISGDTIGWCVHSYDDIVIEDEDGSVLEIITVADTIEREDSEYCQEFGRLYDWDEAVLACEALEMNLPTKGQWYELRDYVGGPTIGGNTGGIEIAGKYLKSDNDWNGDDNRFGFRALPAGWILEGTSVLTDKDTYGYWFSDSSSGTQSQMYRMSDADDLFHGWRPKGNKMSVRCVDELTHLPDDYLLVNPDNVNTLGAELMGSGTAVDPLEINYILEKNSSQSSLVYDQQSGATTGGDGLVLWFNGELTTDFIVETDYKLYAAQLSLGTLAGSTLSVWTASGWMINLTETTWNDILDDAISVNGMYYYRFDLVNTVDPMVELSDFGSSTDITAKFYKLYRVSEWSSLVNGDTGRCMDVDGTNVQSWPCNGSDAQLWHYDFNETFLINKSGFCLDNNGQAFAGGDIGILTCADSDSLRFDWNGDSLRSRFDETIAVQDLGPTMLYDVQQQVDTGAEAQQWYWQKNNKITIGIQTWNAKNLAIAKDSLGSDIGWCWNTDDTLQREENEYCGQYGRLYTWDEALTACAANGMHLPTRAEWQVLWIFTGGWEIAGKNLKSLSGWSGPIGGGDDNYGFTALPGGWIDPVSSILNWEGLEGVWWTSDENGDNTAEAGRYFMSGNFDSVQHAFRDKGKKYSARCVDN